MSSRIYIILSRQNTRAAKLYRELGGEDFDHVSVSFSDSLSVMYSFAKLRCSVPAVGGFVSEYPSRYLKGGGDVPIMIFSLDVDEKEYLRVRDVIARMKTHPQIYTYNIYDKALSVIGGSFGITRSYTDLSFVCRLMRFGDIRSYKELAFVLSPYLTYEGTLNEITEGTAESGGSEYFESVGTAKALTSAAVYGAKLIGRKIYDML